MRRTLLYCCLSLPMFALAQDDGWKTIFDGKTLTGWDGDPKFWSVEDGCLTGTTTKKNPTQGNTFAIWTGGETGDFELKLQYKIVGGNSGIQYRSFRLPKGKDKWRVGGYQADIDSGDRYSGILYGEAFRGILADRGLITTLNEEGKPTKVGTLGDSAAIQAKIKKEDWNDYLVVAKGNRFSHFINGVQTSECTDNDTDTRRASGLLALQLHAGPPMKIQFRNIQIKHTGAKKSAATGGEAPGKRRGAEPADDANRLTVQILPNGGYVLKTAPLSAAGLKGALGKLAEINPEATIRIQSNKKDDGAKNRVKEVRAAVKEAGVSLQGRKKRQ